MISHMALIERDGVKLFYKDEGNASGLAPLLLVHGWSCFHGHLAPQAAHFAPERRVVSVDLRGHGESDVVAPFTIEQFADDVVWLATALELDRPVAIGHSMGGSVVVQAAATRPDVLRAAVALDSPLPEANALASVTEPLLEGLGGPHFQETLDAMIAATMFGPYDDPAVTAEISSVMSSAKQEVAFAAMRSSVSWAGADAVRASKVPLLAISAAPGGFGDAAWLAPQCPHLFIGQTVGAGHFNQIFASDQVNAMIRRFLSITG